MFRKIMLGIAAAAALAAYSPDAALARGGHGGGGFHGGGFGGFHGGFGGSGFRGGGFGGSSFAATRGGGFSGSRFAAGPARFAAMPGGGTRFANAGFRHGHYGHHGRFRHFAPFAVGFGAPYFYDDYYDGYYAGGYDDSCYQVRRVHTRYGWLWRQVDVCS